MFFGFLLYILPFASDVSVIAEGAAHALPVAVDAAGKRRLRSFERKNLAYLASSQKPQAVLCEDHAQSVSLCQSPESLRKKVLRKSCKGACEALRHKAAWENLVAKYEAYERDKADLKATLNKLYEEVQDDYFQFAREEYMELRNGLRDIEREKNKLEAMQDSYEDALKQELCDIKNVALGLGVLEDQIEENPEEHSDFHALSTVRVAEQQVVDLDVATVIRDNLDVDDESMGTASQNLCNLPLNIPCEDSGLSGGEKNISTCDTSPEENSFLEAFKELVCESERIDFYLDHINVEDLPRDLENHFEGFVLDFEQEDPLVASPIFRIRFQRKAKTSFAQTLSAERNTPQTTTL